MAENYRDGQADDLAFLKEAIGDLLTPRLAVAMIVAVALLSAALFALLASVPTHERPSHAPFLAAYAVYLVVHVALGLAVLRILNDSPRPPWRPDLSSWAYGMAVVAEVAIGIVADVIVQSWSGFLSNLVSEMLACAIIAPFIPWFVAIAVERPLAWRPLPYFRGFRAWLPSLLLWYFLILAPAGALHRLLQLELLTRPLRQTWPFFLLGGLIGTAMLFLGSALASAAYRRVAPS